MPVDGFDSPRYPPLDQGILFIPFQSVVSSQKHLLDHIQKTAGLPPEDFAERFLPVINNLARYVHLLPATRTSHHRGAGGLFRLALEMGLYSLQMANSTIFSSRGAVSAEARYKLHPRWVYATFVAGVCAELYRPITNMVVTDEAGERWPQLLGSLCDWSEKKKDTRYFIVWNVQDESDVIAMNQATAAYILNVIVPKSGLQYLNEDNTEVVSSMTGCVTNTVAHGTRNQMHEIIRSVRKKVIERDLKSNSERYGEFTVGSHLEPHLLDAMRKLVRRKTWEVNVKGARVWHSSEGMFIVWQPAIKEIIGILKEDNQPGIPNEADTLADILITSGIAECNRKGGRYWDICLPVSLQMLTALKLQRIEVLFNNVSEQIPIAESLLPENLKVASPSATSASNKKQNDAQAVPALITLTESSIVEPASQNQDKENPPVSTASLMPLDPLEKVPDQMPIGADVLRVPDPPNPSIEESQQPDENTSERVFKSLPADVADYLRAIVEDHRDGSSTGPIFSTPDGVAISTQELESHGQANFTGLVKALYEKTWLWTEPEKPMRKLLDLKHEGADIKVIVIRKDIARSMGFLWKK